MSAYQWLHLLLSGFVKIIATIPFKHFQKDFKVSPKAVPREAIYKLTIEASIKISKMGFFSTQPAVVRVHVLARSIICTVKYPRCKHEIGFAAFIIKFHSEK
jgi:hypothetical protein